MTLLKTACTLECTNIKEELLDDIVRHRAQYQPITGHTVQKCSPRKPQHKMPDSQIVIHVQQLYASSSTRTQKP